MKNPIGIQKEQERTEHYLNNTKHISHDVKVYLKRVPKTKMVQVNKRVGKVDSIQTVETAVKFRNVLTFKNVPTEEIPQAISFAKSETEGKLSKVVVDNRYLMPVEEY